MTGTGRKLRKASRGIPVLACMVAAAWGGLASPASAQAPWSGALGLGFAGPLHGFTGAGGSVGATAAVFRRVQPYTQVGLETGYHRLGSSSTVIHDFSEPGGLYVEDYSWSVWTTDLAVRFTFPSGGFRPYVLVGAGASVARSTDRIHVTDASGAPVPRYDFDQTRHSTHASATATMGLDFPDVLGSVDVGIEARWYGLLSVSAGGGNLGQYGMAAVRLGIP